MLTVAQALILGLAQGITELFPVSSLGHSVLLPALFGWQVDQSDPFFVSFLVLTHLATALVLLGFFWRDWARVVRGVLRSLVAGFATVLREDPYARLGWLLIVGTVPAGIVGVVFQTKVEALFAAPQLAAIFLIGNGLLLYFAEWLSFRSRIRALAAGKALRGEDEQPSTNAVAPVDVRVARLSWVSAVGVGLMQCLALLPGFSRTGATMTGGLAAGLSHEDAARFAFLLATPVILGAAVLKVPHLAFTGSNGITVALAGALAAAIAAFFSVRYLSRYFKTSSLRPFAGYCIAIGLVSLVVLSVY